MEIPPPVVEVLALTPPPAMISLPCVITKLVPSFVSQLTEPVVMILEPVDILIPLPPPPAALLKPDVAPRISEPCVITMLVPVLSDALTPPRIML
jgi:hypothetical protein